MHSIDSMFVIVGTDVLISTEFGFFSFLGFLDGFGYPLDLKSCFCCFCFLVFSMVLAIYGSWNLGFLFLFCFLYGFGYPSGLHTCIAWVPSMVLNIAFAVKVVSSCIPYTFPFPSCLHTWMPLVFIGFTDGFQ